MRGLLLIVGEVAPRRASRFHGFLPYCPYALRDNPRFAECSLRRLVSTSVGYYQTRVRTGTVAPIHVHGLPKTLPAIPSYP